MYRSVFAAKRLAAKMLAITALKRLAANSIGILQMRAEIYLQLKVNNGKRFFAPPSSSSGY